MKTNNFSGSNAIEQEPELPSELDAMFKEFDRFKGFIPVDLLEKRISNLNLLAKDLSSVIRFDDQLYQRISIHKGQAYEGLILTWKRGQMSPIHNHRGSACAVYVVSGVATEIRFESDTTGHLYPDSISHLKAGQICVSMNLDLHIVGNFHSSGEDLVTLHIYSPALTNMELFDLQETIFGQYEKLLTACQNRH